MTNNAFWILIIAFVVLLIIIFSLIWRINKLENFCGFVIYLFFGNDTKLMMKTINEAMNDIISTGKEDQK